MRSRAERLDIVHLGEHLIVVNKSAGMLTVPGRNTDGEVSVLDMLRERYGQVLPVHRIDRWTSGIVAFARTQEMHRHLSGLFTLHKVAKCYLALVAGNPPHEGDLTSPLLVSGSGRTRVQPGGKPARTHFIVQEAFEGYACLKVMPVTGRQHQIRAHFEDYGFPLIVDPVYGGREAFDIRDIKRSGLRLRSDEDVKPILSRTPLHALSITFPAEDNGVLAFEAPLPKDMRACLNQLRKWRPIRK